MLIEDETRLKAWISHIVEDISDAEPDALAKYVIALVKKPLSDADLEKLCSDKLSVFLQAHTESFVSQLFKTLKSGQYLTKKFGSPTQETAKAAVKQPSESAEEEKAAVHTEELVLTDGESDHDHEEHEKEEPSPQKATKETVESSAKPKSESSAPRSAITAKADSSSRQRPKVQASPPIAQPSKPPRKRISPPPRSNSAERRRSSPRRRVIMTGGSMRVSSTRLGAERAERERHYRGGGGRPGGGMARSKSRSPPRKDKRTADMAAEMRVSSSSSSSRRHRCRDFHEKGYCMRGDNCQFDHGPDPVVVENSALKDIVRDAALFDAPTSYGVNPPPPGLESPITTSSFGVGKTLGGVTTEGYNPEAPSMDSPSAATMPHIDFSVPPPPLPQQLIQQRSAALGHQMLYAPGTGPPPTSIMPAFSTAPTVLQIRPIQDQLPAVSAPPSALTTSTQMSSAFGGGTQQPGGGMAMRGGRFKPYNVMAARNPASRSLLVKKIPPEQNKITQLDQHFGKFGQITNIQVQYEGRTDSALVTFKTRRDAMMAYRSTEPIFNNRFIKVFWQNDVNATSADVEGAEGGGPTIPLVGSSADTRPPPKLPIKLPIQYPRYFSKVFAQQKKETEETAEDEKKENAGEADQSEEKKTPPIGELPVVTSSLSAPHIHQPVIAPPPRPAAYNSRVAAMKRRIADKEGMAKMVEVRKMKMNVYGKVVEQQRVMLLKLQQTEEPAQKRKIMELLKKIEANSKVLKMELDELSTKISEMQVRHAGGGKKPKLGMLAAGRGAQVANGSSAAGEGNGASAEHHSPTKSPDKKLLKLCRVVYVSDCPAELNEKLIVHMERFGELFDYDINATPRTFTFKEPLDAQKAVNEAAGSFGLAKLRVEWAPVAKGVKSANDVVPDVDRKPSERVEAKDLLASLDYDEEEEEEEKKNEEEEEKGEESDDEAEDDDDEEEEDEKAERRRR